MNARHALAAALLVLALAPLGGAKTPLEGLDSGPLNHGQSFSFVFATEGTFSYVCRPHPYMEAVVVVAAGESPGPVNATIEGYSFHPATLRVAPGANVTWTNQDDVVHTVSSAPSVSAPDLAWWMLLIPAGLAVGVASLYFLARRPKR